ncbi:MAG: RidA family protein [Candidatus Baltobacteraceae bacterium]
MQFINPDSWSRPRGYNNGVIAQGRVLSLAGQIGWDEAGKFASDDFTVQAAQALRNILTIVLAAGGRAENVVRLTWYVTDKPEYLAASTELGRAYAAIFGSHYPAMTLVVVAALLEDRAKVEIEATAVLPD